MLNVQDHYTYKNKSLDKVNNVSIHPLSNRSLHEYLSNTSYANKFIDKSKLIKSKNFKGITFTENDEEKNLKKNNRNFSNIYFNDYEKENKMFSTHYMNRNESEDVKKNMFNQLNDDKSFMKLVGRFNTSNKKNSFKRKSNNDNNKQFSNSSNKFKPSLIGMNQYTNFQTSKDIENNIKEISPQFNTLKDSNGELNMNGVSQYKNNYNNIDLKSTKNILKNSFNENIQSVHDNENNKKISFNYNPKNINLQNTNVQKFSTINNDNNNNNNNSNNLKQNNRSNSNDNLFFANNFKSTKATHKHDGFSLNNIPRVDNLYKMSDPKYLNYSHTNFHCKKIINSLHLSNNLKINDEMNKVTKMEIRKVNKAKNPKDFVEKLCNLENTKYGRIFNIQQSKDFLNEGQLPEIKFEKKNIEITNNYYNNGNSKFMGVKYNPYNYDLIASKNRTKRNVFGTLFIN